MRASQKRLENGSSHGSHPSLRLFCCFVQSFRLSEMEVTVVKLRHDGEKLSREQLDAAPRVQGFIAIKYWRLQNGRVDTMIKELILQPHEGANCNPTLTLRSPMPNDVARPPRQRPARSARPALDHTCPFLEANVSTPIRTSHCEVQVAAPPDGALCWTPLAAHHPQPQRKRLSTYRMLLICSPST